MKHCYRLGMEVKHDTLVNCTEVSLHDNWDASTLSKRLLRPKLRVKKHWQQLKFIGSYNTKGTLTRNEL